jgi:maleylpyruvate isomerase
MTAVPDAGSLERLAESTTAMIRTVDGLTADDLAAPSLLPGWTRAHVVAHLALNGEALAGVLDGLAHGTDVTMYRSDEARDGDIDELATADPAELRVRLLAACTAFADAVPRVPADEWERLVPRTPGGSPFRAADTVRMRHREVEIHHADLGAGHTHTAWPPAFVADLVDTVVVDRAGDGPFLVRATDLDREWSVGSGAGPVVSGTGADLGWWLTGRGQGGGLEVSGGPLPTLGPWRRAPLDGAR